MLAVGRALCRWREQHPTLAALGLHARLVTDADASVAEGARSVLTLRFAGSDHAAGVPFTLTEELKAAQTEDLPALVTALVESVNGRCYPDDPDAFIRRLTLRAVSFDREAGLAGVATLEWEGEASW
jgi:hypothetical protein